MVVVPGPMESYKEHPAEAMLVVEVSDATLRFDRGKKASLYARADIQDYWIVNLVSNTLEIHREPIRDGEAPLGWRFKTKARADQLRIGFPARQARGANPGR